MALSPPLLPLGLQLALVIQLGLQPSELSPELLNFGHGVLLARHHGVRRRRLGLRHRSRRSLLGPVWWRFARFLLLAHIGADYTNPRSWMQVVGPFEDGQAGPSIASAVRNDPSVSGSPVVMELRGV